MVEQFSASQTVWNIRDRDRLAEDSLRAELDIEPIVAAVLANRGVTSAEKAHKFLDPNLDDLHDPSLLPDYSEAANVILGARERKDTIYVHGDYDVDGVTSTALFTKFLKAVKCEVVPHVPHRVKEGYGIHLDAIQWAKEKGAKVFLTCDCGSSAIEQVKAAQEAGMDVVVTDHHQVGSQIPGAHAFVNPHRSDSGYPFKDLCGVGVALKLCAGLTRDLGHNVESFYKAYLDLAVLGTVADVMPLVDENRVITKFGLGRLKDTKKAGLRALLAVSELGNSPSLTTRHIGFQLGPRINAVGRIADSSVALDLLLTENETVAWNLAKSLDDVNRTRRLEQDRTIQAALMFVEESRMDEDFVILVADAAWHPGVIGLVAGRLVEKFNRPSFVLTIDAEGVAKGSARSIPGFDVGECVHAAEGILSKGGGHEMAAGFSLPAERISEFKTFLESRARGLLTSHDLLRKIDVDFEVAAEEVDARAIQALTALEPFGTANPDPVFCCRGVILESCQATSKPEHVRFSVSTADGERRGMAFGLGESLGKVPLGTSLDIVFQGEANVFNGQTSFRWTMRDFRIASEVSRP